MIKDPADRKGDTRTMKQHIRTAFTLFAGAVFLLSGSLLLKTLADDRQSEDRYEALEQYVSFAPVLPKEPAHSPAVTVPVTEPAEEIVLPQVDFAALSAITGAITACGP